MPTLVRYTVAALLTVAVSGCSVASGDAAATFSPAPVKSTASGTSDEVTGPLGILTIPAGSQPWTRNVNKPLSLDAFVQAFYVKDAWTDELGLYKQRGFVSGAIEGWINTNGTQQSIAIAKFATATGAVSLFDGLTATLRDKPSPATVITDARDDGVGTVSPALDADGNAIAEIAARTGDYVIDVHEFAAATPKPSAAKALLLQQFNSLQGSKNA